jgi:tRNA (guanine37-N1)-methyltransferase
MLGTCIKTLKSRGEQIRIQLLKLSAIDSSRKIESEGDYLYIPVNSNFNALEFIETSDTDIELIEYDLDDRPVPIRSYQELLKDKMPEDDHNTLPRAFDIIGHVAVLKLPDNLSDFFTQIGEAVLSANKNVKSVYISKGIQGSYRIIDLELIAGKDESRTIHTEFGIRFEVDVAKVYFSPRLATERYRVASMVNENEVIIDMFAGVGPFSIRIAKSKEPVNIYAIDINPDAIYYLKRNLELNSIECIEPLEGDAKDKLTSIDAFGNIDRIIMNLPHSGYSYLPIAFKACKDSGLIHYYEFLAESLLHERTKAIQDYTNNGELEIEILNLRKVHSYSPSEILTVFDLKIHKNG